MSRAREGGTRVGYSVRRDSDLTAEEQGNARFALRYLHHRCGNWNALATALGFHKAHLKDAYGGRYAVTASIVFRVARLAKVSVDDVVSGRFPGVGVCRNCGHPVDESAAS